MDIQHLTTLLEKIQGCTFASMDSTTSPSRGITRVSVGERVIMFTNKHTSGYDNMVRRRLEEVGKDPTDFVLGDLPWGQRVPDTPLIVHKGVYYLQTIQLAPGAEKFYIGNREVDPAHLQLPKGYRNQGLPEGREVRVQTYKLENIDRIALMGEVLVHDLPAMLSELKQ